MGSSEYLDCGLFLTGRDQARLSVAGLDYSGRPNLDATLERRLLELDLEPVRYGALLFEALFPEGDDLLTGYRESLTLARHQGRRLRLRLDIATAMPPELHDLHWELLHDPGQKLAFGRSREVAFSRYLAVPLQPGEAVTERPKLLVVFSCPRDLADYGLTDIGREASREALEQALSPLAELMTWEFLESPATAERIRDRLVAGEFHALHLAAHGLLRSGEAMARLALETSDGCTNFVDEELFGEIFAGQQSLRLVSLIACHGGAPAGRDPFSGLGPALVGRGVSAVVAMRRQISLEAATRFAEHFYRNLARGGQVDAATNEARQQLYLGEPDSPEWGTPALFMRLAEGRLWQSPDAAEIAGSQAAAAVVKTLLVSDLVDRARLAEELGDERMAELLSRHDRIARDLLREHEGREGDRTDGFLMLFERPLHAVRWALDFHRAMAELSEDAGVEFSGRVAIHLGKVVLIETPPEDVAVGAAPLAVKGQARPLALQLVSLARGGQTLLSMDAFDRARGVALGASSDGELCWTAHGEYRLAGVPAPIAVYEVGIDGAAPFQAPPGSEDAQRAAGDQTIPGWRPAVGLEVPLRANWRLEKKLSEGGFGEVWMAGHEKIRRQRVFKFCFEAQHLKALQREITLFRLLKEELGDRDDIASILDWNFKQAPYFIESEYAAEGNLVEWTKEQGGIASVPMPQRLEIVAQLATALSAAHSVGVLHKDVKPANVLIANSPEGRPQVRLADFGIGTVTERDRLVASRITAAGLTVTAEIDSSSYSGTRLYMAPELLEGKRATLQADIYALGVVLYQVVVGDFTRALAPGWRRDVEDELLCEDIALTVDGSAKRRLSDAMRIAERLRSLESRRQAREAERSDREQARRAQEALARSRKRRKLMVAVIAASALFVGGMAYQTSLTAKAVARAVTEAETARQVSRFMVDLFEVSAPGVAKGDTITARELLDLGAKRIAEELQDQPITQARLMDTIGSVYRQLGLYDSAQPLVEQALEIRRKHPGLLTDLASSLVSVAGLYQDQDRTSEAERLYLRSIEILESILGVNDPGLIKSLSGLGVVYLRQGKYEEAEILQLRSIKILEEVGRSEDPEMAKPLNNLAVVYDVQGRYKEAESFYERALRILEKAEGPQAPIVATALENLGVVHHLQGQLEEAETLYQRAIRIREKVLNSDHPDIAMSLNNLAALRRDQGRQEEAEALYQRALSIDQIAFGREHSSVAIA